MSKCIITEETLFKALHIWAMDLHVALLVRKSYLAHHYSFQEDACILMHHLEALSISELTIFNYVYENFLNSAKCRYCKGNCKLDLAKLAGGPKSIYLY